MNQQTDKEPIDYLRQRIKYYRKKESLARNLINKPEMIKKYGEDELRYIIARRLLSIKSFIDMYKKAVKDLEIIEENENSNM